MREGKVDLAMNNRNGFPVKNVLYAVFLLVLVYVVYLYHGSQSKLRETEMAVERYRREASNRVTEIQDIIKIKDRLQESCQGEKHEHNNRINAINQKHAMLQSQFKETEADFMKLKNDMEKMRQEHMQAETQHATEYQQFKQQKEIEIADLKDLLANSKQHNEELSKSVSGLQQQIQSLQSYLENAQQSHKAMELELETAQQAQVKLLATNAQLQNELQRQQQDHAQQANQAPKVNANSALNHGIQLPQHQQLGQQPLNNAFVNNMKIPNLNLQPGAHHLDTNNLVSVKPAEHLEDLNAQHQVKPPGNENVPVNNAEEEKVDGGVDSDKDDRGVNPNDEQKVQIQEPNLDNIDKHEDGGEEDRDGPMDLGNVEEARAKAAHEEEEEEEGDNDFHKPQNPLALGQMAQPNRDEHIVENQEQQRPPVFGENKNADNEGGRQIQI